MVKTGVVLLLGLAMAACAPARLEKTAPKPASPAERRDDLTRALEGANDENAVRNLGLWLATAPRGTSRNAPPLTLRPHRSRT